MKKERDIIIQLNVYMSKAMYVYRELTKLSLIM